MLQAYFKNDIRIKTDGSFYLDIAKNMSVQVGQNKYEKVGLNNHQSVGINSNQRVGVNKNVTVMNKYNIKAIETTVGGDSKVFLTTPKLEISGEVKSGPISAVVTPGGPGKSGTTPASAVAPVMIAPQGERDT